MNEGVIDLGLTSDDRHRSWESGMYGFASPEDVTTSGAFYFSDRAAPWVFETARKLDALARRQAGWDSYGGLPLQHDAKHLTLDVLGWLQATPLPVPAVILGSGGTVHLGWRTRGKELEVELGQGNQIDYLKVSADGDMEEGHAKSRLPSRIRDLTTWLMETEH